MKQAICALLLVATSMSVRITLAAQQQSMPIVDVRFDEAYRQIEPSFGDEWAPTWGQGDILYTGNDDGSSFGGIQDNAIAFGQLQGSNPYHLAGITINGMDAYRETPQPGPRDAEWKTLDSLLFEGTRYRFVACGEVPAIAGTSCLVTSADHGKTWVPANNEPPMVRGPSFGSPFFIEPNPDLEGMLGDVGKYIYVVVYAGVVGNQDSHFISRVPKARFPQAHSADWMFLQADGSFKTTLEGAAQMPNAMGSGPDGANWKTTNSYSVNGVLYMFVTRCVYPWLARDAERRHVFRNSSIIESTDNGRNWTRSAADNYSQPMFPGQRFGAPYFVWYGKDGAAQVDNADQYVYAISNDGHFEAGDDYVLGRVLRTQLPRLAASDWTFYTSGDGMQSGSWSPDLERAKAVLVNPNKSGMTGMTYIDALHRYVMVTWHYARVSFETAIFEHDLSTVLEFYEAPKPWGPWSRVKSFNTGRLGWYAPIVGQRFQESVRGSGEVKAFLYAAGNTARQEGGQDLSLGRLNYLPITLSTRPLRSSVVGYVGGDSGRQR